MYKNPAVVLLIIAMLFTYQILILPTYKKEMLNYNFIEEIKFFFQTFWYVYIPPIVVFILRYILGVLKNDKIRKIFKVINILVIIFSILFLVLWEFLVICACIAFKNWN